MSVATATTHRLEVDGQQNSFFWYFSPSDTTVGYL